MGEPYEIDNLAEIDSPALVIYPDIIDENIRLALSMLNTAGETILRPHIKTVKTPEVVRMMLSRGIDRFKCSTIAEAEMLAITGAPDVLLAYQPTEIKVNRLARLMSQYPDTRFSCLIDNENTANMVSEKFIANPLDIYIDVNVGMNRTGIAPGKVEALFEHIKSLKGIRITGLHGYDGHIRNADPVLRELEADLSYNLIKNVQDQLREKYQIELKVIMGGTPTFPIHSKREGIECSPGTFVFWDAGYGQSFSDMDFKFAAVLITRVISIVDDQTLCLDLGSKAVAPDPALPRVVFPDFPESQVLSQSEEHLVVRVPDTKLHKPGDVWMGIPIHICPTVNLYDQLLVIRDQRWSENWTVTARKRVINI